MYSGFLSHHLDGHSSYLLPGTSSHSGRNNHNSLTYWENPRCFVTHKGVKLLRAQNHLPSTLHANSTTSNVRLKTTRCFPMTQLIWICLCTVNSHGLEIIPKQVLRCVYHIASFLSHERLFRPKRLASFVASQ